MPSSSMDRGLQGLDPAPAAGPGPARRGGPNPSVRPVRGRRRRWRSGSPRRARSRCSRFSSARSRSCRASSTDTSMKRRACSTRRLTRRPRGGPGSGGGGPVQRLLPVPGVRWPLPAPATPPGCGWPSAALRRCAATAGLPFRRTGPGTLPGPGRRGVLWRVPLRPAPAAPRPAVRRWLRALPPRWRRWPRPWRATRPACRSRPRRCAGRNSGGPAVRRPPRAGRRIHAAGPGRRRPGPAPRRAGLRRRPARTGSVPGRR